MHKILPDISRRYAVWFALFINQRNNFSARHPPQQSFLYRLIRFQDNKFIFMKFRADLFSFRVALVSIRQTNSFFLKFLHLIFRNVNFYPPGILCIVIRDPLFFKIFRRNSQNLRLQS